MQTVYLKNTINLKYLPDKIVKSVMPNAKLNLIEFYVPDTEEGKKIINIMNNKQLLGIQNTMDARILEMLNRLKITFEPVDLVTRDVETLSIQMQTFQNGIPITFNKIYDFIVGELWHIASNFTKAINTQIKMTPEKFLPSEFKYKSDESDKVITNNVSMYFDKAVDYQGKPILLIRFHTNSVPYICISKKDIFKLGDRNYTSIKNELVGGSEYKPIYNNLFRLA